MTVFPKMADGTPYLWDYQIRGFFKEICGAMRGIPGTKSSKVKAYKKKVDNTIFVEPREIPLDLHGMKIADCQRPLRASTMQGERIALASSTFSAWSMKMPICSASGWSTANTRV